MLATSSGSANRLISEEGRIFSKNCFSTCDTICALLLGQILNKRAYPF